MWEVSFGVKLLAAVLGAATAAVVWRVRIARARTRLREIDLGTRCVGCDGVDMERSGDRARCRTCGYAVSMTAVHAAYVRPQEIEAITRPADAGRRDLLD